MKRAFIAGKLGADNLIFMENVRMMNKLAKIAKDDGFAVYVPCNDLILSLSTSVSTKTGFYQQDLAFLEVCDIMYLRDEDVESSVGVQGELKRAKELVS